MCGVKPTWFGTYTCNHVPGVLIRTEYGGEPGVVISSLGGAKCMNT